MKLFNKLYTKWIVFYELFEGINSFIKPFNKLDTKLIVFYELFEGIHSFIKPFNKLYAKLIVFEWVITWKKKDHSNLT